MIAAMLAIPTVNVFHHLAVPRTAGLVVGRKHGGSSLPSPGRLHR
jgi:hypothetical protein